MPAEHHSRNDIEPNGVATQNFQCMTLAPDRARSQLYCLGTPNGNLYHYNPATGTTTDLGRHDSITDYLWVGRFMWVDEAGVVYFSYQGHTSVSSYDPATETFTERTDWQLLPNLEIKFGQWSVDGRRCYMGDYEGGLYLFDDDADPFTRLGQATVPEEYYTTEVAYLWMTRLFEISADEKKMYFMNEWSTGAYALFEYDIAGNTTTKIAELSELDAGLPGPLLFHSGYDSWDAEGRFVYNNFNQEVGDLLLTSRIDPVRVKVQQGLLPELVSVGLAATGGAAQLTRTGATDVALSVMLAAEPTVPTPTLARSAVTVELPAGAGSVDVSAALAALEGAADGAKVSVVPNGNTYVAAPERSVGIGAACQ